MVEQGWAVLSLRRDGRRAFIRCGPITYRATVTDPIAYTRPWTIEVPLRRQAEELIEIACHEDNGDLQHLKDARDAERAKLKKEK